MRHYICSQISDHDEVNDFTIDPKKLGLFTKNAKNLPRKKIYQLNQKDLQNF